MSETDELTTEEEQLSPDIQALLRKGRKAERDAAEANAKLAARELQDDLSAAGVANHPARELVFRDYDGPRDAESLKAHAEKFGIVVPASPGSAVNDTTEAEQATQRRILDAGGGSPAANGDIDLAVAFRNAKSQAEVRDIIAQVSGNPGFRSGDGLIGVLPTY